MKYTLNLLYILALSISLTVTAANGESSPTNTAFRATWRLLSAHDKKLFMSGYLHALEGGQDVTQIVLEYVRQHPDEAVTGLEKIKNLYRVKGLSAERIVSELDAVFEAPEGKDASLPQAFAIVKRRLGR